MNADHAIKHNQEALLRIVAALVAMVGLKLDGSAPMMTRLKRSLVVKLLRTATSATRRLIVCHAQALKAAGYVTKPRAKRPAPKAPIPKGDGTTRAAVFPLIDPRKTFGSRKRKYAKHGPQISFFDDFGRGGRVPSPPPKPEPSPDDLLDATSLARRLSGVQKALENLPAQAKRLLRMQARPRTEAERPPLDPIRPGHPPGHRQRPIHEVDELLRDCHALAQYAMRPPDT